MTRVLVVDDERKMRRVLQILLEQMGFESVRCGDRPRRRSSASTARRSIWS